MAYHTPEPDNCNHRFGQGKNDMGHGLYHTCAVNLCRILHLPADTAQEITHNNKIPGTCRPRQYQHPSGVQQMQALQVQISGNQSSSEEHGKDNNKINRRPPRQFPVRHGISRTESDEQSNQRPHSRAENGIGISNKDCVGRKHFFIGFQRYLRRPELKSRRIGIDLIREGKHNCLPERVDKNKGQEKQDNIGDNLRFLLFLSHFHHNPSSPSLSLFTVTLEAMTRIKPITFWNSPAAVA